MPVMVITDTPGLDAEGYEQIVMEQGPQVFPLHYALTRPGA